MRQRRNTVPIDPPAAKARKCSRARYLSELAHHLQLSGRVDLEGEDSPCVVLDTGERVTLAAMELARGAR